MTMNSKVLPQDFQLKEAISLLGSRCTRRHVTNGFDAFIDMRATHLPFPGKE